MFRIFDGFIRIKISTQACSGFTTACEFFPQLRENKFQDIWVNTPIRGLARRVLVVFVFCIMLCVYVCKCLVFFYVFCVPSIWVYACVYMRVCLCVRKCVCVCVCERYQLFMTAINLWSSRPSSLLRQGGNSRRIRERIRRTGKDGWQSNPLGLFSVLNSIHHGRKACKCWTCAVSRCYGP